MKIVILTLGALSLGQTKIKKLPASIDWRHFAFFFNCDLFALILWYSYFFFKDLSIEFKMFISSNQPPNSAMNLGFLFLLKLYKMFALTHCKNQMMYHMQEIPHLLRISNITKLSI